MEQKLTWSPTRAGLSLRYDDIWFVSPLKGWAVNSSGEILMTEDGGDSWVLQHSVGHRPIWMRSICFTDPRHGWAGAALHQVPPGGRQKPLLYHTRNGETWRQVRDLPALAPTLICGLWPASKEVVYASGTAQLEEGASMMKTTDGGKTWHAWSMEKHASMLIDVYFPTPDRGWVVGGILDRENCRDTSSDSMVNPGVVPVVLYTEDGGATWTDQVKDHPATHCGEWGWKIQFLDDRLGFISVESASRGAVLKTEDGGKSWHYKTVTGNENLEGVGFLTERMGWVGGWGPLKGGRYTGLTSVTHDGGDTWREDPHAGKNINRYRIRSPGSTGIAGYSSGLTVYRLLHGGSAIPETPVNHLIEPSSDTAGEEIVICYTVPPGTRRVTLYIWNRFAKLVRVLLDEKNPAPGRYEATWDGRNDAGMPQPTSPYLVRLVVEDFVDSAVVSLVRGEPGADSES